MTSPLTINDVAYLLYKAVRFHVVVGMYRNRSQKTSKGGWNISDALSRASCATSLLLPHFHVIFDLLLDRYTVTWKSIYCTEKADYFRREILLHSKLTLLTIHF